MGPLFTVMHHVVSATLAPCTRPNAASFTILDFFTALPLPETTSRQLPTGSRDGLDQAAFASHLPLPSSTARFFSFNSPSPHEHCLVISIRRSIVSLYAPQHLPGQASSTSSLPSKPTSLTPSTLSIQLPSLPHQQSLVLRQ